MNLFFRADASVAMGTGHVMRCLALAQAWQDAGGRAVFAMAEATSAIQSRLTAESCEVVSLSHTAGSAEDASQTIALADERKSDWMVVDGYQFGGEYQSALKRTGRKVLFIDDNGHAEHYSADLVLNQNAYACEDLYRNREAGTELLLGLQYAMLRREFRVWRELRRDNVGGGKVLVILGGSDPANLMLRVVEALEYVRLATLDATIVLGGSNPHTLELESAVAKAEVRLRLLRNVTSMPEVMAWADIAVSSAGTTALELAFMGVPTILVTVADNQRSNARACAKLEIALNLGDLAQASPVQLAAAVRELIADSGRRTRMTHKARTLVDGLGAERVAARLIAGNRRRRDG